MAKRKLMKNKNSKKNEEQVKNLINGDQQLEPIDDVEEVEEETEGFWARVPRPVKTGLKVAGAAVGAIGVFALGMLAGGRKSDSEDEDWSDFQELDNLGLIDSNVDSSADEGP